MVYGLYYCYSIDIQVFKPELPHVIQQKHQVSKHANRVTRNNSNFRKRGYLKQPGGSSCNQRR